MKSEIAKKHRAEEGAGWQPVSALVRDALRATVVCPGAQAMCDVKAAFDASPLFTLKKLKNKICRRQVPFNLHAVYEFKPSNNDVSILVEIQIHDSEVRKASAAQQRFYQIFRAISSEKLHKVEAHHTMTHSKLMKQRSQPAWKSTRDIREPPRHREPTRSRGQHSTPSSRRSYGDSIASSVGAAQVSAPHAADGEDQQQPGAEGAAQEFLRA